MQVEVEDWDTGASVLLKLDTTKSTVEQTAALYKKARKMRRAVDAVAPLMEAAEGEVAYLEDVGEALAQLKEYRWAGR